MFKELKLYFTNRSRYNQWRRYKKIQKAYRKKLIKQAKEFCPWSGWYMYKMTTTMLEFYHKTYAAGDLCYSEESRIKKIANQTEKALEFARDNSLAIGAHIGFPDIAGFGNRKMELPDEELEAIVLYQVGAISSYAQSMGLEIEHVRCHGAMYEMLNSDIEFAKKLAYAIKKINPWLVLIVGNYETKETLEREVEINCAYEETFGENSSIREFREGSHKPDTLHFTSLECAKRAHQAKKPTPLNYNKVGAQL